MPIITIEIEASEAQALIPALRDRAVHHIGAGNYEEAAKAANTLAAIQVATADGPRTEAQPEPVLEKRVARRPAPSLQPTPIQTVQRPNPHMTEEDGEKTFRSGDMLNPNMPWLSRRRRERKPALPDTFGATEPEPEAKPEVLRELQHKGIVGLANAFPSNKQDLVKTGFILADRETAFEKDTTIAIANDGSAYTIDVADVYLALTRGYHVLA